MDFSLYKWIFEWIFIKESLFVNNFLFFILFYRLLYCTPIMYYICTHLLVVVLKKINLMHFYEKEVRFKLFNKAWQNLFLFFKLLRFYSYYKSVDKFLSSLRNETQCCPLLAFVLAFAVDHYLSRGLIHTPQRSDNAHLLMCENTLIMSHNWDYHLNFFTMNSDHDAIFRTHFPFTLARSPKQLY